MNVTISEKKVITGISIHLSPGRDVEDFINLLEMARRQIEPMRSERLGASSVRDMMASQFDSMDHMLSSLFACLEDMDAND